MEKSHEVAVIVVTCNRKRLLERCIKALLCQSAEAGKICIVDNASTDGTGDLIADFQKQEPGKIDYIVLPDNIGGAGGFRRGFQWAAENSAWDWLLVMDDDAAPDKDYIKTLFEKKSEYPEVLCCIGTEYVGDTERIACGSRRIIDKECTLRTRCVPEKWYEKAAFYVDTATFVGLMMHRSIVEKAGFPDASFFIYYDDTDYCFKMRPYTRILHVTGARIVHRENYEKDVVAAGKQEWREFYLYRNEAVIKKRYIKRRYMRYGWIIKNYIRKILEIVRKEEQKGRKIWIVSRATWDVVLNRLGKAEYIHEK